MEKPVRIGDFVRLESGTEGHIVKVGWRSTLIRMTSNNIVVIPNSKLASQRLTNYDLWEKETAVTFDVSVAYDNDLEKVEKITVEVGSQILATVEGGIGSFKPLVRFHTFNHSQLATLDFTVVLRARQITDQSLLKHEMIKALHRRFKQEGVVILTPGLQLLHTMNRSS